MVYKMGGMFNFAKGSHVFGFYVVNGQHTVGVLEGHFLAVGRPVIVTSFRNGLDAFRVEVEEGNRIAIGISGTIPLKYPEQDISPVGGNPLGSREVGSCTGRLA